MKLNVKRKKKKNKRGWKKKTKISGGNIRNIKLNKKYSIKDDKIIIKRTSYNKRLRNRSKLMAKHIRMTSKISLKENLL